MQVKHCFRFLATKSSRRDTSLSEKREKIVLKYILICVYQRLIITEHSNICHGKASTVIIIYYPYGNTENEHNLRRHNKIVDHNR